MWRILVLVLLLEAVFPSFSLATGVVTGRVTHIHGGPAVGTKISIAIDYPVTSKAPCATNEIYSFAIDSAAPGADVWLSMLMISYTTEKRIYLSGNNQCTHIYNVEDAFYIQLVP